MSDLQDIRTVPAADVSQRRFHDRVVIVTGAGGGIGAAISARFADEGAHVIVCDANDTAAVSVDDNLTGLRAQARVFDVTDADACRALTEQTISEHWRIDVLVNNAGLDRRGDLLSLGVAPSHRTKRSVDEAIAATACSQLQVGFSWSALGRHTVALMRTWEAGQPDHHRPGDPTRQRTTNSPGGQRNRRRVPRLAHPQQPPHDQKPSAPTTANYSTARQQPAKQGPADTRGKLRPRPDVRLRSGSGREGRKPYGS